MERAKELVSLCRDHGICLAYLFGSRAREGLSILEGKTIDLDDPLADLDLGIVFNFPLPPPGDIPELYAKLYNLLSDLFYPFPWTWFFSRNSIQFSRPMLLPGSASMQRMKN